jgi:hypothetical protein
MEVLARVEGGGESIAGAILIRVLSGTARALAQRGARVPFLLIAAAHVFQTTPCGGGNSGCEVPGHVGFAEY